MFNVTNYSEHPTNQHYIVFRFAQTEQAEMFKELLVEEEIYFESDSEDNEYGLMHLIAVKSRDEGRAARLNFTVIGKFRQPFITNKFIRVVIYIIAITMVGTAVLGHFMTN